MKASRLVDPVLFSRLSGVSIRMGGSVEGAISGRHRSSHHGASVEFSQHREYSPGDEIKHIDWKSYGRSDRIYVKQYEDETDLRTLFVMDSSKSMGFSHNDGPSKLEYASQLATALAWVLIQQGDAVGLLSHGNAMGTYLPPRSQPDHFWRFVSSLESEEASGQTDLTGALSYVAGLPQRRCNIILLSDCFDFSGQFASVARQLRRRHFVSVLHILDPAEIEFPFGDLTIFEGMEDSDEIQVDPRAMKEAYLAEFAEWSEKLRRELLDGQVDYHRLRTDQALDEAIFALVEGAKR
jgi:uncharacterized protein (DUF58 family)